MSSSNNSLAMQRIVKLLDENSFMEVGSLVTARSTDFNLSNTDTPSDGVIIGHGLIGGSLVFIYSQDASVLNGTIGEMHAKKIASVYDMAMKMGAPVIGFLDCAGIRLQESVDALNGLGQIYLKEAEASGVIPQISAVFSVNCLFRYLLFTENHYMDEYLKDMSTLNNHAGLVGYGEHYNNRFVNQSMTCVVFE